MLAFRSAFCSCNIWWTLCFANAQSRGRDGGLWGMALSSLFFCGVHWNPVYWSCLLASVSFCFAFHSLFKFCEFRGRRDVSWFFLKKAFFRCHRSATRIGYACVLRCAVKVGMSFFRAGTIDILPFASHRMLRAMDWTFVCSCCQARMS